MESLFFAVCDHCMMQPVAVVVVEPFLTSSNHCTIMQAQLYNGIAKESTAFKLLACMGWKEGDGLVSCLQVKCLKCVVSQQHC